MTMKSYLRSRNTKQDYTKQKNQTLIEVVQSQLEKSKATLARSQQVTEASQLQLTQQLLESKFGKNSQQVQQTMQFLQSVSEKQRYIELLNKYDPELLVNPAAGTSDDLIRSAIKQGILQPVNSISTLSRAIDASYHNQQMQPLTLISVYDRNVYNQVVYVNQASEAEKRLNQMISKTNQDELLILDQNKQLKHEYKQLRNEQINEANEIEEMKQKIQKSQEELENDKEYTELLKQRTQWQRGTCSQLEKEIKSLTK